MASRSRLWHRELDTLSTGIRTREYLTVHRNVDIIIKSLADRIDPGLFAQKLHEAGLVSVYWRVCAAYEFTASDRVHDMIFSVQIHINRESSKYDVFMRILKDVHPNLAERLTKYFTTDLRLNAPRAVTGVCDWEELGRLINYDPIKLTLLQSSGYSPDRCREEMVTDWTRQGQDASWMKLARALDQMNEAHLADEIRRQYLPSPEHEDESSSSSPKEDLLTVSQITDSDVAREIEDLSQVHPSQKLPVADSQLSERQIQATIERHGDEFLRYIEWEVLVPYLKVEGLLDGFAKSFEPPYTRCREERLLTFFLKILRTRRGPNQYTRFYRCLAEAKCFGHQLLMELFE